MVSSVYPAGHAIVGAGVVLDGGIDVGGAGIKVGVGVGVGSASVDDGCGDGGSGDNSAPVGAAVGSSGESSWHDHDGLSTRVDPITHVSHTNTNASVHKRSFHVLPVVALYPKPLVAQSWPVCSA